MPDNLRPATFPENTIAVTKLCDPLVEQLGYDLRSLYVEKYWLSVLGPSATLLLRRLALGLELQPDGYPIDVAALSIELGLGTKGGKNGPLWRSIERICRFKAATRNRDVLAVRTALPPLALRYLKRLPENLQLEHLQMVEARAEAIPS